MVPDLQRPAPAEAGELDINTQIDRFQLFDETNNVNCTPTIDDQPLSTTKFVPDYVPATAIDLHSSPKELTSNGTFWTPLKAIPLASYYRLHRVPSLTAMEQDRNGTHAIELPRSEPMPSAEPQEQHAQEKVPQNGIHNKLLEHVVRTPGRQPSPQPTHLSVPGSSHHRILHEEDSGYVAPKFEGKELQMDQGRFREPPSEF
jgi:hypothetical protein